MTGSPEDKAAIELWAGIECTVNRVGSTYFDQLERNGHARRIEDLDRLAELGVRTVRYPALWERMAPGGLAEASFAWTDERLGRLRDLEMRPILGLVHHGSGPRSTSLVDPGFAPGLASFARAVAERYPWVEDYTPVNEPLTTARFSGLYGHWYPHLASGAGFARTLVNQCRAVVLAMRAVREVNPRARLIQTEDMGMTFSTPTLAYQAAFENARRWLSFDLLSGRVDRSHPLHAYLLAGATEEELERFVEEPCPPDVIGLNYYLTSDRFLDERLDRYPAWSHGGNGRHAYADIESVRVIPGGVSGHRALLGAAHQRYGRPVAITEAHFGGTREEQLRWLLEAWRGAAEARAAGADVRAVAAWSAFGVFDWDRLVVCERGHYESGVFDIRGEAPRPTALAAMVRALAAGREPHHPILVVPGWWRRPDRILYPTEPLNGTPRVEPSSRAVAPGSPRPLLITGAHGRLGVAFARICARRGLPYRTLPRSEMDIADPAAVARALERLSPWAVINAAGYVRIDDAEHDAPRVYRENTWGPEVLATACQQRGVPLVTVSSDLVFDGAKSSPYLEDDAVAPLGVYGLSKVLAERRVLALCPSALIARTAALFGPWDEHNFVTAALRALGRGLPFRAASDATISPTYVPDFVNAVLDLLIDGERGVWHLANRGAVTWAELAEQCALAAGVDPRGLVRCGAADLGLSARRPDYSALGSSRGLLLPSLEASLASFVVDTEDESGAAARWRQ
ncbi:MAG: sugar nucleotide-binding protein [Byssovorax sp.]